MRKNNGMTLVALVVTIIIMIILAGISANLLFSERGIFQRAKEQKEEQKRAQILEELELAKSPLMIENDGYTSLEKYLQLIKNKKLADTYQVTNVEQIDEANGIIWIDEHYKYTAAQIGVDVIINFVGYMMPHITSFYVKNYQLNSITVEVSSSLTEEYEFYIGEDNDSFEKVADVKSTNEDASKIETINYIYDISNTIENNKLYYLKIIAKNRNGKDEKTIMETIKFKDAFSGSVSGYSSSSSTHADAYFPLQVASSEINEYFTYSNNIITFKKDCTIIFEGQIQNTSSSTNIILGYYLNKPRPTNSTSSPYVLANSINYELRNYHHTLSVKANDYLILVWKAMHISAGNASSAYQGKIDLKIQIIE